MTGSNGGPQDGGAVRAAGFPAPVRQVAGAAITLRGAAVLYTFARRGCVVRAGEGTPWKPIGTPS